MTDDNHCDDEDDKVGYGKPPKKHRFKPGQSGNPTGKRKTAPGALMVNPTQELNHKEAHRMVTIREGNETRRVPAIQAAICNMMMTAAKGDRMAVKDMLHLLNAVEAEHQMQKTRLFESAVDYKHNTERDLRRWAAAGLPPPDLVPHPDHILIFPRTGDVQFIGPMDESEKAHLEEAKQQFSEISALKQCRTRLAKTRSKADKAELTSAIKKFERIMKQLDRFIAALDPEWKKVR